MLSERQQTLLKLAGLIATAGLMGLALYFMIFKGGPKINPPTPGSEVPTISGGLPTAGNGTPGSGTGGGNNSGGSGNLPSSPVADGGLTQTTLLTTSSVLQPTITSTGKVAYYDPRDGKFYSIDAQGNVVPLSQASFPQASDVVFADNASAAVVEFPDGSNVVYDFNSGHQTTLPAHWQDFSFSGDASELASKSVGTDPSNRELVITTADGSNTQVIAPLGANDALVDVNWSPDGNIVGFSKTGTGGSVFGQNEIYLIGADGQAAGVLIVNGTNFKNIWAPDGTHLLYSIADAGDDYRASLWYEDAQGDRNGATRLHLSLKTTVDKCVFASTTLAYCAAPLTMPAGGGAAPSLVTSPDSLYSINLPSGQAALVATPDHDTQMSHLSVSADGRQLYYTDAAGRLNLIQLK